MKSAECHFCSLPPERIVLSSLHAVVIRDGYPISPGHTLIIPRAHIQSFFDLSEDEIAEIFQLLRKVKLQIDEELKPDSYNIGINDGSAAGQTIPHLHIHLIPRYHGDVGDPRGGVRWIIPEKAIYWTSK